MVATGTNPALQLGRGPDHPPAVPVYSDKWVRRTYSSVKSTTAGQTGVDFLQSSFSVPGTKYFVDKLQVWRLGISTNSSEAGLLATFKQGNFTDLGADDVSSTDFGTGTSLAAVTCKVPLGHATGVSTTGTSVLVSCNSATSATGTGTENYVCHLTAWVSL